MKPLSISDEIKFTIKRGPIDSRSRELVIHPEFLKFEVGYPFKPFSVFSKSSIKSYRFGIRWINGYTFTVGREYQIFIENDDGQVLKINFKSFYGIGKSKCHNQYVEILKKLWNLYFFDIANSFLQQFEYNQEFTICDVKFDKESLKIKKSGFLSQEVLEIPWNKVRTYDYQTYFVIYSVDDPARANKSFYYLQDWNVDVLQQVTKIIVNSINSDEI